MTEVRWALLARADLARIDEYYRAIDHAIADRIGHRLFAATDFLADLPFAGPVAAHGDRRKWSVAKTPYVVLYRVAETHIRVLRVLHAAEDQRVK